jgi:hypothetical protein
MPVMIRKKGDKGQKIAFALLGTPANISSKSTTKQMKLAEKIFHSSTSIIR